MGKNDKYKKAIEELNLFDDDFMKLVFSRHKELAIEIIKPILAEALPQLKINYDNSLEITPEADQINLGGHSVVYDVAVHCEGTDIILELQKDIGKFSPKRGRFYNSSKDTELEKGSSYDELPTRILIVLALGDIIGNKRAVNRYAMMNIETHEILEDGQYVIYINCLSEDFPEAYEESEKIIKDLLKSDPETVDNEIYKKILREYKVIDKEGDDMGTPLRELMDDYADEKVSEALKDKNKELKNKDKELRNKDKALEDKDKAIEERDVKIRQLEKILKENKIEIPKAV